MKKYNSVTFKIEQENQQAVYILHDLKIYLYVNDGKKAGFIWNHKTKEEAEKKFKKLTHKAIKQYLANYHYEMPVKI